MDKWIIVRAGGTVWQEEKRLQGTIPLPLCNTGHAELERIALATKPFVPQFLYSSGNESSGKSAEALARWYDLKPRKISDLREYDCGLWQGMLIEDIEKRFATAYRTWRQNPTSVAPCQGESLIQVYDRVLESLEGIRRRTRGKTVIIVTAHLVSAVVDCILTGSSLEQFWEFADEPVSARVYEWDDAPGMQAQLLDTWHVHTVTA